MLLKTLYGASHRLVSRAARFAAIGVFCAISLGGPPNQTLTKTLAEVPPLKLGERIRAEIPAGAIHRYHVEAASGQYVKITAEDAASALRLTLLDAGARKLRDWVGADPRKPIELIWILDSSGPLLVGVGHRQKGSSSPISYEIRLEALRAPTEQEVSRFSAMWMLDEARAGGESESEKAWRRAIEKCEAAAALYMVIGDPEGQATALGSAGGFHNMLGEVTEALELMPEIPNMGDRTMADFLRDAGEAYRLAGERQKALEYFLRRLARARASGGRRGEAESLALVAMAEHDLGRLEEARKHIEEALGIREEIRTRIINPDQRSTYFSAYRDYYDFYVQLLMELNGQHPGGGLDKAGATPYRLRFVGPNDANPPDGQTGQTPGQFPNDNEPFVTSNVTVTFHPGDCASTPDSRTITGNNLNSDNYLQLGTLHQSVKTKWVHLGQYQMPFQLQVVALKIF